MRHVERESVQMSDEELVVEGIRAMARILSRAFTDELQSIQICYQEPEQPKRVEERKVRGEKKLITAEKLADMLSIPISTVYRLAREKKIPVVRIGRTMRFDIDAVSDILGIDNGSPEANPSSLGEEK